MKQIYGLDWVHFLALADIYLKDRIKADWGSYAWKANKEEILKLTREWPGEIEDAEILKEDVEYGVVFKEEC